MKTNKLNLNSILLIICLLGIGGSYYVHCHDRHKTGYIILQQVFDNFEFKKESQKKFEQVRSARKKILDSLMLDLTVLAKKIESKTASKDEESLFEKYKLGYEQRMREFEEDTRAMTSQYDKEIITQLNQYVKDFGTEQHYDIIFGNTDGSLMYGNEKFNITIEVTAYINDKYKGVK